MTEKKQTLSDIQPKEKKLCHFRIMDGNEDDIIRLTDALGHMKKEGKIPEHIEFISTNDKYELRDIKYLLKELYALYQLEKKFRDEKEAKK